jgi:hypothetical protein
MIQFTDLVHLEIQCSKVRMFRDCSQVARWIAKRTRLQKLTISDLFQRKDERQLPWKTLFDELKGLLGALSWRPGSGDPDALDIDLNAIRRSIKHVPFWWVLMAKFQNENLKSPTKNRSSRSYRLPCCVNFQIWIRAIWREAGKSCNCPLKRCMWRCMCNWMCWFFP